MCLEIQPVRTFIRGTIMRILSLFGKEFTFYKVLRLANAKLTSPYERHYIWNSGVNESKGYPKDNYVTEGAIHVFNWYKDAQYYADWGNIAEPPSISLVVKVTCKYKDYIGSGVIDSGFQKVHLSQKEYDRALNVK